MIRFLSPLKVEESIEINLFPFRYNSLRFERGRQSKHS